MSAQVVTAAEDWATSARRRRDLLDPTERALLDAVEEHELTDRVGRGLPLYPSDRLHPWTVPA